jgi:hypothetical protein
VLVLHEHSVVSTHEMSKAASSFVFSPPLLQDRTTSIKAVKDLLSTVGSTDKTFKEVPGGYHELLLGPEKEQCGQWVVDWILGHAKSQPKAAGTPATEVPSAAASSTAPSAAVPATGSATATTAAASTAPADSTAAGNSTAEGDVKLVPK